jgi:WD40 repeat protein
MMTHARLIVCVAVILGAGPGAEAAKPFRTLKKHTDTVWSVDFSPDGKYLASGSKDGTTRVWETKAWKHLYFFEEKGHHVTGCRFVAGGQLLITQSFEKNVKPEPPCRVTWWDLKSGKQVRQLKFPVSTGGFVLSPDRKVLATGAGQRNSHDVLLRDAATGKLTKTIETGTYQESLAFSPDGKRLAGLGDGEVTAWDVKTAKAAWKFTRRGANSIAFSPDGQRLACGGGAIELTLHESKAGKRLVSRKERCDGNDCLLFVRREKALLSVMYGWVNVLDAETGKHRGVRLAGSGGEITALAVSPDGKLVAGGAREEDESAVIDVWEVKDWQE